MAAAFVFDIQAPIKLSLVPKFLSRAVFFSDWKERIKELETHVWNEPPWKVFKEESAIKFTKVCELLYLIIKLSFKKWGKFIPNVEG